MFKVGDQVRFHPEFIAIVHKEAGNRKEAEKEIYTVVDVRMWEPHPFLMEELPPALDEAFRAFLARSTEIKTEQTLILIGNHQPEQKICIKNPDGEQAWLNASYFELVS